MDHPSDESLRMAIVAALAKNEKTTALNLRVGVVNGVAHLGGSAPALGLRQLAQDIAAQTPGIRGVVNRIESPGAPAPGRIIHLDLLVEDRSRDTPSPESK